MPVTMPPKNKKDFSWGRFSKTLSFWILILLVPVALIQLSSARGESAPQITYTKYREELARDNISKVTIQAGKTVRGEFKDRIAVNGRDVKRFTTQLPMENSPDEVKELAAKRVTIQAEDARPSIMAWIVNFLPWLLLIGFYLFLFKQMQAGGAQAVSFGKSKAETPSGGTPTAAPAALPGGGRATNGA